MCGPLTDYIQHDWVLFCAVLYSQHLAQCLMHCGHLRFVYLSEVCLLEYWI